MTAPRDIGQGPGEGPPRRDLPGRHPERYRGCGFAPSPLWSGLRPTAPALTGKSARRQAMEALGIPSTAEGRLTPTAELIARLFDDALATETKLPG